MKSSGNPLKPNVSLTPLASALALALGVAGMGGDVHATAPTHDGTAHLRMNELRQELAQLKQKLQASNLHWPSTGHQPHRPHAPKPNTPLANLVVTSCADDAASSTTSGTLRYAVANANDSDEIDLNSLSCSSITLTQGALPVTVDNLTVVGPGTGTFIIDGNGTDRVFTHTGTGLLALDHITVRNGYTTAAPPPINFPQSPAAPPAGAAVGGCVYSAGAVYLDHSVVSGCTASTTDAISVGGGVYAVALYMNASTISGNTAVVQASIGASFGSSKYTAVGGGALAQYLYASNGSRISGNVAIAGEGFGVGGGAFTKYSNLLDSSVSGNTSQGIVALSGGIGASALYLQNSTLSTNTASGVAGTAIGDPLYAVGFGGGGFSKYALQVQASTITGNIAQSDSTQYTGSAGGGLALGYSNNASASIAYSTIDHNQASFGGGLLSKYSLTLVQSTISGNSASYIGGGVLLGSNSPSNYVFNSTIADNSAGYYGGGIFLYYGTSLTMQSTLVAGNTAESGEDIYASYTNAPSGTLSGSSTSQVSAVTIGGSHNLVMSATNVTLPGDTLNSNPLLQALADNGGPTRTHLLGAGSPAAGVGSNPNNYTYDQRGPGFPRMSAGTTDIGAVELAAAPVAADTPVPALSTWAMGLLAGLLGWFGLRRRKIAPQK